MNDIRYHAHSQHLYHVTIALNYEVTTALRFVGALDCYTKILLT